MERCDERATVIDRRSRETRIRYRFPLKYIAFVESDIGSLISHLFTPVFPLVPFREIPRQLRYAYALPFRIWRVGGIVLERRGHVVIAGGGVRRSKPCLAATKRKRKEGRKEGRKEVYQCSIEQRYTALLEEGRGEKRKGIRLDGKRSSWRIFEMMKGKRERERALLTPCLDLSLAFPSLPVTRLSRLSFPPMGHDTASSRLWDEFAASRPAIMH